MGLINFLKSKFSKKDKKEEKESQVTEEKKKVETEEEIENKYIAGLDKSRIGFTESMKKLAKANKVVNDEYFDELERILIEADVGVDLSIELIKEASFQSKAKGITDAEQLNDLLIDLMFVGYANKGGSFQTEVNLSSDGPTVILLAGVNGVGKTTTLAKLATNIKTEDIRFWLLLLTPLEQELSNNCSTGVIKSG